MHKKMILYAYFYPEKNSFLLELEIEYMIQYDNDLL